MSPASLRTPRRPSDWRATLKALIELRRVYGELERIHQQAQHGGGAAA